MYHICTLMILYSYFEFFSSFSILGGALAERSHITGRVIVALLSYTLY